MLMVKTVRGQVDVSSLGQVLMHEHVFTLGTEIRRTTRTIQIRGMRKRVSRMRSPSWPSTR